MAMALQPWIAVIVFITLSGYIPMTIVLTEWRGKFRRCVRWDIPPSLPRNGLSWLNSAEAGRQPFTLYPTSCHSHPHTQYSDNLKKQ